jgi:hypothetical protein
MLLALVPAPWAGAEPDGSRSIAGGEQPEGTTLPVLPEGAGRIVERPNTGQEPDDPGDRGGWLQISLFWLIMLALATIGLLAWRDSKKKRARRAPNSRPPAPPAP